MPCNVGGVERAARIVLGIALLGTSTALFSGTVAMIGYVVGGIALITGLVRFCPLSAVLGINTCQERSAGGGG